MNFYVVKNEREREKVGWGGSGVASFTGNTDN
jgi:hypothetical protein